MQNKTKYWENHQIVQIKFLAMDITKQNVSFDIVTVRNLLNIFMEHDLNVKIYNFDPYNVFMAIATNIPQRLKTGFVLQGHKWLNPLKIV